MKKLLVLGIGGAQLDLIQVAKEMGIYVYAIAKTSDGIAYQYADEFIEMDIFDIDSINKLIKEKGIDAVYTAALEISLPVITRVSLDNNLRTFVTEKSLEMFKDKSVWRKALGNTVGNLRSRPGFKLEDFKNWDIFPAIIKPADGSGQRGVHKVNSFKEIEEVFDNVISFSKKKKALIEEFAEGEEISINSFMYKGELAFYEISDRISYTEYPGGIIKEHHIPSKHDNPIVREKLEKLVKEVSRIMEYDTGHVYYQLKIKDNEPKIIEFTPRYDACHMWRLVKVTNNINLMKASLEYLLYGKSEEIEGYINNKYEKNEGIFKLKFISDKPGTIVNKKKYKISDDKMFLQWYYEDGEIVKSVTGYIEKVGYYIVEEED